MAAPKDPWQWSVDEVVHVFCKTRNLWNDNASSVLPNAASLELKLRENDINGSTLLTEVDREFLRSDCGINSLGQRSSILKAIDKLKDLSPLYAAEQIRIATRQQSVRDSVSLPPGFKHERSLDPPETPLVAERTLPYTPPYQEVQSDVNTITAIGSNARPDEHIVEDGNGRKRRRLNLTSQPPTQQASLDAASDKHIINQQRKSVTNPDIHIHCGNGFLGKKLPVDDVFFGTTKSGRELQLVDGYPTPQEPFEDDEFTMALVSRHAAVGERMFVAKRMRHFLGRAQQEEVERNQSKAIIVRPYPAHVKAKGRPAVLLYETRDGRVTSTKTDPLQAEQGLPLDESLAGSDNQWDFLLHWQDTKDTGDCLADLQSIRSSQISEGLARELDEEEEEHSEFLTTEEVSNLIEETLAGFAAAWNAVEEHKTNRKAWHIWQKDRRLSRQQRIDRAKSQIYTFEQRLRGHKVYLLKDTYKTANDVRRCCTNSKLTVEMREQERFKIEVLKGLRPPPRPARGPTIAKLETDIAEDGGIIINSESEDDELDDFVEDDQLAFKIYEDLEEGDELDAQVADDNTMDVDLPPSGPPAQVAPADESSLPTTSNAHLSTSQRLLGPETSSLINSVDEADVEAWLLTDLEEEGQRTKLLLKILLGLSADTYQSLRSRAIALELGGVRRAVQTMLATLAKDVMWLSSTHEAAEAGQALHFTQMFAAWHTCRYEYSLNVDQETAEILWSQAAVRSGDRIGDFHRLLEQIFTRFPQPLNHAESLAKLTEDDETPTESNEPSGSEDEDEDGEELVATTPKKKAVRIDPKAVIRRQKARNREAQSQAATQRLFVSQSQDLLEDDDGPSVLVNVEEEDEELQVFIHPQIARQLQQHQIDGVRFLWREVITSATSDDDGGEGCLLAHTMGLGKTMQTITFLVTLVEATRHRTAKSIIPVNLHRLRTLILCPPSLINNWIEEFHKWVPRDVWQLLGDVFPIDSTVKPRTRLQTAQAWASTGGILLIGYELFRQTVHEESKTHGDVTEEEHQALAKILLEEPRLIVADESHYMKNVHGRVFKCANRFKSRSRIALTGSPLANNLIEYFAMIHWVSPGYLGSLEEFRASYSNPIADGLYADSTRLQHRRALKKLNHLLQEIHPKVNRASVNVLKGSLMPKVEFVLRLESTKLQRDLYAAVVRGLRGITAEYMSNAQMWSWMGLLLLVNNHPHAFQKKLLERRAAMKSNAKPTGKAAEAKDADIDEEPDEIPLASSGLSDKTVQELLYVLKNVPQLEDPKLSSKVALFLELLGHSISTGDRMLVFSRSLYTLSYLEMVLAKRRIKHLRLDGKVAPTKRQGLSKAFNSEDQNYKVFLISTLAGGTGFNLPGANRVVIFDFGFNPAQEDQAVGRSYRLGQTKPVFVYRFVVGGTYEDAVYEKTVFKTQLAYRTLEKKNISRKANKTSDFLFPPRNVESEPLNEHMGKDIAVLDKILDSASTVQSSSGAAIKSIKTAETLQQEAEDEKLTPEEEREVAEEVKKEQMRRERPAEYQRKYITAPTASAPMPVAGPSHPQPQPQPRPLPLPLPQVIPPPAQLVSSVEDRRKKIEEVGKKAGTQDHASIFSALASSAWRVPDAIKHLMQSTVKTKAQASLMKDKPTYGEAIMHSGPSTVGFAPGGLPDTATLRNIDQVQNFGNHRTDDVQNLSVSPPHLANRWQPEPHSSLPAEIQQDAGGGQNGHTAHSALTPNTANAEASHTKSGDALLAPMSESSTHPASLAALEVPTNWTFKPLASSAVPGSTNDEPITIDLVSSEGEDPQPPRSAKTLKRFSTSRKVEHQSDGAFDSKPVIARGSSQAIYQSDGWNDVLLQPKRERTPPFSSQGWVQPRSPPPRL